MDLRKVIVSVGLIVLIVGFAALLFQEQEIDVETVDVDVWDLASRTLAPSGEDHDSTFYGTLMKQNMWFRLNVSSSDTIELRVSVFQHDPDVKVPIINPLHGTSFNQEVFPRSMGTYFVDLKNESPSSVSLEGNVLVKQRQEATPENVHPYFLPGAIMILAGTIFVIFGVFKKPKKRSKTKSKIAENLKT
jgi:hypothetical protein